MTPSPDIIRDFAALQADCKKLGESNIRFVGENERLKRENARLSDVIARAIESPRKANNILSGEGFGEKHC